MPEYWGHVMIDFRTPNINNPSISNLDSARTALGQIQTWAQWMAGIQTAAIGAIGAIASPTAASPTVVVTARPWGIASFIFLSLGLYFSAWVLSSVPSINIRLGRLSKNVSSKEFDIHCWPSFTWPGGRFSLGLLMGLQHWCWALGLACFGVFALLKFLAPNYSFLKTVKLGIEGPCKRKL